MKRKRINYKPEEKAAINTSSTLPVFYRWQKEFFDNGASAFLKETSREKNKKQARTQALEQKLQRKHEVLSELMKEPVKLKKSWGI